MRADSPPNSRRVYLSSVARTWAGSQCLLRTVRGVIGQHLRPAHPYFRGSHSRGTSHTQQQHQEQVQRPAKASYTSDCIVTRYRYFTATSRPKLRRSSNGNPTIVRVAVHSFQAAVNMGQVLLRYLARGNLYTDSTAQKENSGWRYPLNPLPQILLSKE